MAAEISLLYPSAYNREKEIKMKDFKFIRSLQISDMIILKKESYRGFMDLQLENFYSADPEVLRYRLDIVEDLVNNDALYETFCEAVNYIFNISDMRTVIKSDFSMDSALGCLRVLEMYQEIVTLFADTFKKCEVHSEGMKAFRDLVLEIDRSEDFKNLCTEMSTMDVNLRYLKCVTIAVNLDDNLRPKEAGILSVSQEYYKQGSIMDKLLKKKPSENTAITSLYPIPKGLRGDEIDSLNYTINRALYNVFAKTVRDFEPMIHKYYNDHTNVFVSILDDIRFLTAGVGFIRSMKAQGYSMCKPVVFEIEDKRCDLEQVYNPMLAKISTEKTIVSNSFSYDDRGRFYLVTGPNHGGKSIFAYSIGMTQALFQLGLFVPAKSAYMSPVTGIYTHFPSSDENNYGKGRLESECARLGEIMGMLTETDILLMDESFSSTSGLEAGYIASEVLTGIGVIGCGGIFVTHIHDLSLQTETYNTYPGNKGKIDNLVALMENAEDGTRSYKISRTTPDGLSHARDIASRYGLNLEGILGNR